MIVEKKAGRHTIYLDAKEIGNDLLIAIYGGDEHHIGGVAAAYPTASHYRDATTVSVSTLTLPGHKDYVVANTASEKICKALELPTVVTVGIHYDNASSKEIEEIISIVNALVDEMIAHYQKAE
jgi:alpha-beta hydrolase superfamily lysophospholipase